MYLQGKAMWHREPESLEEWGSKNSGKLSKDKHGPAPGMEQPESSEQARVCVAGRSPDEEDLRPTGIKQADHK